MLIQFEERLKKFILFILILFVIIFIRYFYIFSKYKFLKNENLYITSITKRGLIFDRDGVLIAGNYKYKSVFIDPSNVNLEKDKQIISDLEDILSINKNNLIEEIKTKSKNRFLWIKRFLTEDEYNNLKEKKLKKVYFKDEYKRVYPQGELFSNVIGFCNIYLQGMEGIEYFANNILYNSENKIYSTIDSNIQFFLYSILKKRFEEEQPQWCGVIVQDALNGEILGAVKFPTYDPELYYLFNMEQIKNNLFIDSYEPGSAFKVFTFSCLFEYGLINLNFKDYCTGYYKLTENIKIQDLTEHGNIDLIKTFKYSCNYGTIKLAENLNKETFFKFLQTLNFGSITGIEFPGETKGILKTPKNWTKMTKAIINIGQEIGVSAIQMISAFSSIINGGNYFSPKLIKKIEYSGGGIKEEKPIVLHKTVSENTSEFIKKLLIEGISKDSTGREAFINLEGVQIGGKTGTAQIPDPKGGYFKDKNLASFLGFFNYKNRLYSIYIIFYDPKKNIYGGSVAAPVFKEIVIKLKNYIDIKENRVEIKKDIQSIIEEFSNYKKVEDIYLNSNGKLPSFVNLTLKEAIYLANLLKIKVKVFGSGFVYYQSIEPGEDLKNIKYLILKLKEENY
ncbi:MAG: transpeptidase family protein [Spirochaetes bacterium]|nr:transpeptidase family protein [Spirochaetota bacterium]